MKIKLHWKLTLIFCSTVMIGLFIGYFYLTSHLKGYVEGNLENNLRYRLLSGRDLVESYLDDRGMLLNADAIADRVGKQQDLRVTIIARDGTVLGDTNLNADEIKNVENHLDRPEIQEALRKGIGLSKRYSYTIKKYLLYMAIPFGKEKQTGFLRYAVPISYVEMLKGRLEKTILGALLLVFLASLVFTFVISFAVSKPLVEMAGIAKAMAKGDFSRKPSVYSKDEIGDLAMALTNMSEIGRASCRERV